jgi:hypothetical protein
MESERLMEEEMARDERKRRKALGIKFKGRPPLEPRIKALEDGWNALIAAMRADFLAQRQSMEARIGVLEKQIAAMNDAFSHGHLPRPAYEAQFKVWPGASPITNGN